MFHVPSTHSVPKNQNLYFWGICLKMVSYKVYHQWLLQTATFFKTSITPIQCHTTSRFWEMRIHRSVRIMKEWLKPLIGRYKMALSPYISLQNFCFELPFKVANRASSSTAPHSWKFNCLSIQPRSSLQNSSKNTASPEKNPEKYS